MWPDICKNFLYLHFDFFKIDEKYVICLKIVHHLSIHSMLDSSLLLQCSQTISHCNLQPTLPTAYGTYSKTYCVCTHRYHLMLAFFVNFIGRPLMIFPHNHKYCFLTLKWSSVVALPCPTDTTVTLFSYVRLQKQTWMAAVHFILIKEWHSLIHSHKSFSQIVKAGKLPTLQRGN